ncbi:Hypothetical predicted protein [Mytilus galloprovincialis]|uniref:Apple domain-containing protein n=1 Tax=Mytilus galloprovincialis TaxID=29158 RepID=A0A8B6DAU7_MYTGA|nr:Hypothetical predicted protein [Mytilus galloprovincialis]
MYFVLVVDMCTDDSAIEDSVDGIKPVDSVVLRITKQQNNCICHVSLQNNATNYTIYMSKYEGQSNAAPTQQNCGLEVDVIYIDTLDTARSLQSIACSSGTGMRSIALRGGELQLKSRIINGSFNRGYCMQIFRSEAIYNCSMIDQLDTAGIDNDWKETHGTQHTSFDECKRYCLQSEACQAVHYETNYCFVYNRTTTVIRKPDSIFSRKDCVDTQSKWTLYKIQALN